MSAQPATGGMRWMDMLKNGLGAPLVVLALLAMIVVPLAPPVLDALFSFNIAISLVVLLAVIYVKRPLDFTIFPIILLMTTMLRLALNVASTRVILINGQDGHEAAGKVIAAFGEFVVGGNYAVGIVVFAILTIINFVVITKGAGRIAEVSARFILDAMPGKQMAIDADLNAGILTREEAKARREEVRAEADFYGSMDGANKFIRGDAIAGILILFINLIGGFAVGMFQHGMPAAEAASTYTLLSIGDGLVAQLPALLVSSAVAMLVTRASRSEDMGQAVMGQAFGQHKALAVAAGVLGLVGLVPGMPNVAFLTLAAGIGYLAWKMWKRTQESPEAAAGDVPALTGPGAPDRNAELTWDELRPVDPLGLEVGYRLIPLVDKNQGGELMSRIKAVRRKLTQDLGFLVPPVHIRDNLELPPTGTACWCTACRSPRPRSIPTANWPWIRAARSAPSTASPARTRRSGWTRCGSSRTRRRPPNRWATPWSIRPPSWPRTSRTWCANTPRSCSATRKCSSCSRSWAATRRSWSRTSRRRRCRWPPWCACCRTC